MIEIKGELELPLTEAIPLETYWIAHTSTEKCCCSKTAYYSVYKDSFPDENNLVYDCVAHYTTCCGIPNFKAIEFVAQGFVAGKAEYESEGCCVPNSYNVTLTEGEVNASCKIKFVKSEISSEPVLVAKPYFKTVEFPDEPRTCTGCGCCDFFTFIRLFYSIVLIPGSIGVIFLPSEPWYWLLTKIVVWGLTGLITLVYIWYCFKSCCSSSVIAVGHRKPKISYVCVLLFETITEREKYAEIYRAYCNSPTYVGYGYELRCYKKIDSIQLMTLVAAKAKLINDY